MNTVKIRKGIMLLTILTIFLLPQLIYAQDVNLRVDSMTEDVEVGDLVVIRLTFESEDLIGTISADISYDSSRLEYQYGGGNVAQFGGGTGGVYDSLGTGVTNRSYEFTFRALEAGTAQFTVDFSEIIAYEAGHLLGEPTDSIAVTISSDTIPETSDEEPEDPEEVTDPEDDNEEEVPDEDREEPIINTLQEYRLFSIYQQLRGFEMTVIQAGEETLGAFQSEELPENVYLVFASQGEEAPRPYFFDQEENTLQRAWIEILEVERESEVSSEEDSKNQLLSGPIVFLIVLALILIIALVILDQGLGNTKSNKQQGDQDEI